MLRSFFCLLLFPFLLSAQVRQVQTYTVAEGLAQSQVYTVLADSRGYVWAGTQGGGLSRFDGKAFETFSDVDGLPGNYIQCLYETKAGNLWIGTSRGLAYYDGKTFQPHEIDESVRAIVEGEGPLDLVVLTDDRIHLDYKMSWQTLDFPKPYLLVYDLILDGDDILLATDQGVWRTIGEGKWKRLATDRAGTQQIWSFFRYAQGGLWAVSPQKQLYTVKGDSLRSQNTPAQTPTVFYVSPQGDSWLGSQGQGVYYLPKGGKGWLNIRSREGLGSDHVRAITSDIWGNVWIGTSGGGLSCLREAPFQSFDQAKGLAGKEVYALTYDDSLGVIYSAGRQGIYHQSTDGPQQLISGAALSFNKIKSILREEDRLWLATPGDGLYLQTDSSLVQVNTCGKHVIDIIKAGKNQWWVATAYEGLSLLTMSQDSTGLLFACRAFGREHDLPIGRIERLEKDNNGRLLIAYRDLGLACWEPNRLHWRLSRADGLPSNTVRAVRQDSVGYYWLASPRGLVRVGRTETATDIKVFTNQNGLQSNNLYCLTLDQENNLWLGSEQGVDKVELDAARNIRQVDFFGREEGFTGIETCTDAALCDPEGNVWLGTMNGLMLHPEQALQERQIPPPVLRMTDMRIKYQSVRDSNELRVLDGWGRLLTKELQLTYQQNHLSFDLRALDLAQPKDVRYQWMLDGWDEQWSLPSEQATATYANLPPGAYTFRARALGEGERRSSPLILAIEIEPAYWQTSWFRGLVIGFLSLLLLGLLAWQFRKYQRKQEQVAERLRLDNRLLELEQKALQLQMNPHFLANALQGIQYELNSGRQARASNYLTKFGDLMRSTLYHSRASRITLSDEIDNLRRYLDLERFRLGDRFDYQFDIPAELEVDLMEIPPMLLQPFLENAVQHGLHSKPQGGKIHISFAEEGMEVLLVRIQDNGQGLTASSAQKREGHQSTALKVIRERLDLLGLEQKNLPYEMKELRDGERILGVLVEVRLPVL